MEMTIVNLIGLSADGGTQSRTLPSFGGELRLRAFRAVAGDNVRDRGFGLGTADIEPTTDPTLDVTSSRTS